MDQRSTCLFLALTGFSARVISNKFTTVLDADAIASPTVAMCLCQRQFTSIFTDLPRNQRQSLLIKQFLMPLSSIHSLLFREVARLICVPTTAVHRHLTQSLGFVAKHLRWVPHTLTPTQKPSVQLSQLSSCASSDPSNTTLGSSFSPFTSHGSISRQTMNRSGFA
jgi:hypothetical protein